LRSKGKLSTRSKSIIAESDNTQKDKKVNVSNTMFICNLEINEYGENRN